MRATLLIACFITFAITSFAQQKPTTILITRFEYRVNEINDMYYYSIEAEPGNLYAPEIYGLKHFDARYNALNTGATFYPRSGDSANRYFNYFRSPTLAIEYLNKHGWQMVLVISETWSVTRCLFDGKPQSSCVKDQHTIIQENYSRPVYYFKKEIEN